MTNKIEPANGYAGPIEHRNVGRPKGAQNKTSSALKTAMLLASDYAGHKVAMKREMERIEKLRKLEREEGIAADPAELVVRPEIIEGNGLLTYLTDLAVSNPVAFSGLLGKVITVQQEDELRGVGFVGPKTISIEIGFIDQTKVITHVE